MTESATDDVTKLLLKWGQGERSALDRLVPLVQAELRRIAHGYMRKENTGHTLQTSALVNEAYLRLVDAKKLQLKNRIHFLAISAGIMRRILVDSARSRRNQKRGGGVKKVPFEEALEVAPKPRADLVALDDAMKALAATDPRKCSVVELRYFGGLSVEETAQVLAVSPETVLRDWKLAKSWLAREIKKVPIGV